MRKKIIVVLFFILICCVPNIVFADDLTCNYDDELILEYKNGDIVFEKESLTDKWYRYRTLLWNASVDEYYVGDDVKFEDREELEEQLGKSLCPTVYLCEETTWGIELPSLLNLLAAFGEVSNELGYVLTAGFWPYKDYFDDSAWSLFHLSQKKLYIMTYKTYKDKYKDEQGGSFSNFLTDNEEAGKEWCTWGDGTWWGNGIDGACGTISAIFGGIWDLIQNTDDEMLIDYKELHCNKYEGNFNITCSTATANLMLLDIYIEDYKKCASDDNQCKLDKKIMINQKAHILREQCNLILSNYDYSNEEKECIDACLSVGDKLKDINDIVNGKCGLSGKMIQFIGNIIKWVKYIVPVIVIVLGILDFIKAIGTDKEDETKKAQGRFVKRLISAALIFIIPFILEFVLNKMGFAANGCGIIDL